MGLMHTTSGLYEGKTLTNLEDGTLSKLGEPAQTFTRYTQAEIRRELNTAQREFAFLTRCLRSPGIIILQANKRYYPLPSGFLDFVNERWPAFFRSSDGSGYTRLARTTTTRLDQSSETWRDEVGTPKGIFKGSAYGNRRTIGVYPIPDTNGTDYVAGSDAGITVTVDSATVTSEYGVITSWTDTDLKERFFFGSEVGVLQDITDPNGNLFFEYVRYPFELSAVDQYPEIPAYLHEALEWRAAAILIGTEHDGRLDLGKSSVYMGMFDGLVSRGKAEETGAHGFPETLEVDSDYLPEL